MKKIAALLTVILIISALITCAFADFGDYASSSDYGGSSWDSGSSGDYDSGDSLGSSLAGGIIGGAIGAGGDHVRDGISGLHLENGGTRRKARGHGRDRQCMMVQLLFHVYLL